jgi:hypothetical protein
MGNSLPVEYKRSKRLEYERKLEGEIHTLPVKHNANE